MISRSGSRANGIATTARCSACPDGIVRRVFATRNVRVRPLPADVLAAIDALPRAADR
jgi:hypothetical protein